MYQKKLTKVLVSVVAAALFMGCSESKEADYVNTNPFGSCASAETADTSGLVWTDADGSERIKYLSSLSNDSACVNGAYTVVNEKISYPKAVAADEANGIIYVSDRYALKAVSTADESISIISGVADPRGLAVASNGDLYVVDATSSSVKVVSGGAVTAEIGAGDNLKVPHGLALSEATNSLYVAEGHGGAVQIYSLSGTKTGTLSGVAIPQAVAVNAKGQVYVVHNGEPRVSVFSADGKLLNEFGPRCSGPGCLEKPKGIAIASDGNVFISDMAFENIQVFDANGQALTVIGQAGNSAGTFTMPNLLYMNSSNQLYVAEMGGHRVQVFQYTAQ